MLATIYKLDLRNWGLSIEGVVSLRTSRGALARARQGRRSLLLRARRSVLLLLERRPACVAPAV